VYKRIYPTILPPGELLAAERERKEAKEGGKKAVDDLTLKTKFLEKQRNELLHGECG
jgi:hypothetical protein